MSNPSKKPFQFTRAIVAFIGGVILLFGARLAGGCPSGHGLSGLAQLALSGFIAMAFFFIGGGALYAAVYPFMKASIISQLAMLTKSIQCDTIIDNEIQGGPAMPISLRIPPEKNKAIQKAARKAGTTKTAIILEAVDEKLGLTKSREQLIRELAGWMTHEEAEGLRQSVEAFSQINAGDWD